MYAVENQIIGVQYGNGLGIKTVYKSGGACFDGPVAFSGGQQRKNKENCSN